MARIVKLPLTASPTFEAEVPIPVPGARNPVMVPFTFKGMTLDAYVKYVEGLKGREDVDVIMEIVSGWGLEDAFGRETVIQLTQSYLGASRAILDTWVGQLTAARLGNSVP